MNILSDQERLFFSASGHLRVAFFFGSGGSCLAKIPPVACSFVDYLPIGQLADASFPDR